MKLVQLKIVSWKPEYTFAVDTLHTFPVFGRLILISQPVLVGVL